MIQIYKRHFIIAMHIALLAACGGGGSSGGNRAAIDPPPPAPPPPPPPPNEAPVAAFTLNTTSGDAPLVITVNASGSSDADGVISSYTWDFNGEPGIGVVAQFVFRQAGNFTIGLTVTDDAGGVGTSSRNITVSTSVATYTLSGTVSILSSTAVDGDVNDRLTTVVANDTFDQAQQLLAPVTLGGFANVAGSGESSGNLFTDGDPADFYHINLNGNEVIALTIAESSADLDLRLWDDQRNLVDASLGSTSTETIATPQAGSYFIEVVPIVGASNYLLQVGQSITNATSHRTPTRMSDPYVAGELIVKRRRSYPAGSTPPPLTGLRSLVQQYAEPSERPEAGLYALANTSKIELNLPQGVRLSSQQRLRLQTLISLKTIPQDPDVEYVELNLLAQAHATPDDPFYSSQWHYRAINLPLAWDITTGTANVIVAVVDTGVLVNHPDLSSKLIAGYDFISDATRARDGDGLDPNPNDPGDLQFGSSSSFHGTHVAGTIGAATDNGEGAAGVTWQTSIMPLRVLGVGGGTTFDVVQAVRYAAGLSNNSGTLPIQRADIINLSLGSSFSSQSEQDAYTAAIQAGVIIVASAGNETTDVPSYPASYDGVISVSATTISNSIASYSNFGSAIDIAAPGGSNITDLNGDGIGDGVISSMGDDSGNGPVEFGYAALSGTSMAAPHVAGVIALMKSLYPTLSTAEFNAALLAGDLTDDLGSPGRDDQYGYGLINATKAILTAQALANGQSSNPGPIITASASTLNFGAFQNSLNLTLQNVGSGNPTITAVSISESWVGVTAPGSSDGLGEYQITVDRNGLSEGAYQATVNFAADANDVELTLIMQVSSLNFSADAGLFYIILVDEDGDTALPAVLVSASQGEYPFSVTNVPAGEYRLFAGSDADDDSKLCDAGEACGAYSTLDAPDFIAVNGDLNNLDFEAGFRVNLSTSGSTNGQGAAQDELGIVFDKAQVTANPQQAPE